MFPRCWNYVVPDPVYDPEGRLFIVDIVCYLLGYAHQDGTLARLRSVPGTRHKCEPNRSQCTVLLREVRLYPPEGAVLKTYGVDGLPNLNGTTAVIKGDESLPTERVVETFVPMA